MSFKDIVTAKTRASGMSKSIYSLDYAHPLAACICNHVFVIGAELEERRPNYLFILVWIDNMAKSINKFCDVNLIESDNGAKGWLRVFLSIVDVVCMVDKRLT